MALNVASATIFEYFPLTVSPVAKKDSMPLVFGTTSWQFCAATHALTTSTPPRATTSGGFSRATVATFEMRLLRPATYSAEGKPAGAGVLCTLFSPVPHVGHSEADSKGSPDG